MGFDFPSCITTRHLLSEAAITFWAPQHPFLKTHSNCDKDHRGDDSGDGDDGGDGGGEDEIWWCRDDGLSVGGSQSPS